jgi:hypothetical protein
VTGCYIANLLVQSYTPALLATVEPTLDYSDVSGCTSYYCSTISPGGDGYAIIDLLFVRFDLGLDTEWC